MESRWLLTAEEEHENVYFHLDNLSQERSIPLSNSKPPSFPNKNEQLTTRGEEKIREGLSFQCYNQLSLTPKIDI